MNSRMAGFERDTLTAIGNSKRVWLIHLVANALLMVAFFYWVRVPDDNGFDVAITVLMGAAILLCTMWLHAATLDYFHRYHAGSEASFTSAMRATLARVPAFLIWVLIFGAVLSFIGGAWDYDAQVGGYTRHLLPLFLRRHASPRGMTSAFSWLIWIVFYLLWPIVFLPIGAQVAKFNFRGFIGRPLLAAFRPLRSLRFWILYVICFVIGAYFPYLLAKVAPRAHASLHYQTVSVVTRLGIAYLLLVTVWLVICSATTRVIEGRPERPIPDPIPVAVTS